ncbi:MAG: hypothetical protein ABIN79_12815 [Marmoricola sp.]
MLKPLVIGFVVVALGMVLGLVYYALAHDGGLGIWVLAVIWTIALVLIPLVAIKPPAR